MLYMKALMRPVIRGLRRAKRRGALDVVFSQPDDGTDKGAGRRDHVAITALACLLEDAVAAHAELGQAPEVEQRPEAKDTGGVEFPDDARAPLTEDRLGTVEQLEARAVTADQELGRAGREAGHSEGVRMSQAVCEGVGGGNQLLGPPPGRAPLTGDVHGFPPQGQRDPQRLTGLECQEQASGLVVCAADHINDADADGH